MQVIIYEKIQNPLFIDIEAKDLVQTDNSRATNKLQKRKLLLFECSRMVKIAHNFVHHVGNSKTP